MGLDWFKVILPLKRTSLKRSADWEREDNNVIESVPRNFSGPLPPPQIRVFRDEGQWSGERDDPMTHSRRLWRRTESITTKLSESSWTHPLIPQMTLPGTSYPSSQFQSNFHKHYDDSWTQLTWEEGWQEGTDELERDHARTPSPTFPTPLTPAFLLLRTKLGSEVLLRTKLWFY
jgi:hypothetical protein